MDNVEAPEANQDATSQDAEFLLEALEFHTMKAEEVFALYLTGVTRGDFCACHVLEAVQMVSKTLMDDMDPATDDQDDKRARVKKLIQVGLLTLDLVWRATEHTHVRLRDCSNWQRLLFASAALVNRWVPELGLPRALQVEGLQHFVATLMMRPEMCPDRLLRLELLRFVSMWNRTALAKNRMLCRATTIGVFNTMLHLTPERLLPRGRVGLLWPLTKVLYDLNTAKSLHRFTARSAENIMMLDVGPVDRALARLLLVMGCSAFRLLKMRRRGERSLLATIDGFDNLLQVLLLLVATPPHNRLCELPGMCQIAAGAVAAAAHCIVRIPEATTEKAFHLLLSELDDFFLYLATHEKTGAVRRELQQHHGRCLKSVGDKMLHFGCPVVFIPRPLTPPTRQPPKEFLDSQTRRLMEMPVRLEATGAVVDLTTLMLQMLVDSGQRDLTFNPLPELQEAIQAWRDGGSVEAADEEAPLQDSDHEEGDGEERV